MQIIIKGSKKTMQSTTLDTFAEFRQTCSYAISHKQVQNFNLMSPTTSFTTVLRRKLLRTSQNHDHLCIKDDKTR